ncbi:MAG TPA: TetR/AcrR family transcriptional regulator [Glaciibacter sp.]|nr:TetR/AcrR family transcriptional regulator [Glaciibacter sp.]
MSRASQADAAKHRDDVITAASRLLRERGAAGVSVQEAMSAAGLTHGGFYKHFGSKEELVGIAAESAFGEVLDVISRISTEVPASADAGTQLLDEYLSVDHRDNPGAGCANTGLASDSARAGAESILRQSYIAGVRATIGGLSELLQSDGDNADAVRGRAIEHLATMVGALTLARATKGDPLSEEILDVVRRALTDRW